MPGHIKKNCRKTNKNRDPNRDESKKSMNSQRSKSNKSKDGNKALQTVLCTSSKGGTCILGSTQENSCQGAPSDNASSSTEVSDNSPDVSLENEMFTELPSNSGRMDDSSISASGIQESSDDPESDQPTYSHAIDLSFDDLRISSRGRVIKPKVSRV
ncbi:hypothetical protein JTB14_019908 [Gonioctena quinquepunctata]|nr:hypothetical protein JTB14_019908 [Gonioctena quinquepunctata]